MDELDPVGVDLVEDGRDVRLLLLRGELEIHTLPSVREAIVRGLQAAPHRLVLDVSDVTFAGPPFLGLVAGAEARGRSQHTEVIVRGASDPLRAVFQAACLGHLLDASTGRS